MITNRTAAVLFCSASLLVWPELALAQAATAAQTPAGQSAATSEVVVTAPRQANQARTEQFVAPNLIDVQSAETIAQYPDFNAAEALGRIPGVSLSSDTGEGRFVIIRGIDPNLDGATYGGVVLLNTNPGGTSQGGGGRAVEFDTIPTGAIDGIIVTKTGLPDHEAEGIGGSVELSPRTANNISKPFFEGQLGYGYEPLHGNGGPFDAETAFGARFGFDGRKLLVQGDGQDQPVRAGFFSNPTPFSFVLTASTRQDRRAVDDLEASYTDDGFAPSNSIHQYDLRRYDYHRRRYGYGGEFDFKPNEDHRYYARVDIAGYNEAVHKNFLLLENLDAVEGANGTVGSIPVDPNNPKGFLVTTNPTITLTDEQEAHRNQVYVVGGEDHFGETVLDYHVAYSRATFRVNYNNGANFQAAAIPITYDNQSHFAYPVFGNPSNFNFQDPSNYALTRVTNNFLTYDADEERTYAANLLIPVPIVNDTARIKIGGQARIRDKTQEEYNVPINAPDGLSLADASTGAANIYYDGMFPNGPFIDRYTIRNIIAADAQPREFQYGSFFHDSEDVFAGYFQYSMQLGKLGILAGVRVENTQGAYGAYLQTPNADGSTNNTYIVNKANYTNAFPTVQLRYEVIPKLLARATYSTAIGRPGFNQNTASTSLSMPGGNIIGINQGNPNLKPITSDNYDFDLSYYLPRGGIIEVGLFDKELSNYIVSLTNNNVVGNPLAGSGNLADITTYGNISSAYARGIEGNYHQQFVFLPAPFDGLGLDGNITLVDSRIQEHAANQTLSGVAQFGPLPGTSRVTYNAAIFYLAHGLETRLSAEYVSHSLFGIGNDKSLDVIQDKRFTVDLTTAYNFTDNYGVYFNAKNLSNTPLRYYEGDVHRPIQREFYDATFEGGVRVKF